MNLKGKTPLCLAFLLLFVMVAVDGLQAAAEDVMKKSFDVSPGGELVIATDLGSIAIETHDRDVVLVEMIRRASDDSDLKRMKLEVGQNGNTVMIRGTDLRRGGIFSWFTRVKLRVRFVVTVPNTFDLDLKTAGGSIRIGNLKGEILAKTSGGSLTFGNIHGNILGRTSGGSIRVGDCIGDIDVDTSGGSITIGKVSGNVEAHTSGGSVNVKEAGGTIDATTAGGSITAALGKQPDHDCVFKTHGGSVRVYLPEGINVDVDARTIGGRVRSAFNINNRERSGVIRKILEGEINEGGPLLLLRTSGGSIYIKKKDW